MAFVPALDSCQFETDIDPLPTKVVTPPVRLSVPVPAIAPLMLDAPESVSTSLAPTLTVAPLSVSSIDRTVVEAVTDTV